MKRCILLSVIFFFLTTVFCYVYAYTPSCNGTKQNPCIVQDTRKNIAEVKHLRDMQMIIQSYKGNVKGLDHIWVSGSGATSSEGWKAIALHVAKATQGKAKKMINVDLRQESHGYLNGNSINLTSEYNWINREKTPQQILSDEQIWLDYLSMQQYIPNVLTVTQFKSSEFLHGANVPVEKIVSEAELMENEGFHYIRLTVSDHMAPLKNDIDRFIRLVDSLPNDTWMHIHCRGGNGRTATFMTMFDMLKNANHVSFDEIIRRQASVTPFYNLYVIDRKDPVLSKHYKARLEFLRYFYQFAKGRLEGHKGSWIEWIERYPLP